jgi:hypothetical protein
MYYWAISCHWGVRVSSSLKLFDCFQIPFRLDSASLVLGKDFDQFMFQFYSVPRECFRFLFNPEEIYSLTDDFSYFNFESIWCFDFSSYWNRFRSLFAFWKYEWKRSQLLSDVYKLVSWTNSLKRKFIFVSLKNTNLFSEVFDKIIIKKDFFHQGWQFSLSWIQIKFHFISDIYISMRKDSIDISGDPELIKMIYYLINFFAFMFRSQFESWIILVPESMIGVSE